MNTIRLHFKRWAAILALGAAAIQGFALSAGASTLSGRVSDDTTGLPLEGTRIQIQGTSLETYSSRFGDYAFASVPAGEQRVTFSYVGYPDLTQTVTIAEGAPARLDALFGSEESVELEAMVVEGTLVGTARAINQQRAALTLSNIVAADEIGNFPDQNAAESLQRIPGLALYRDQGEGRYIILRGLNYTYTSVKVNGGSFAGADLGDRATALDVIPTDALASVEVTKVPTPDMDGEGLGGQVNIKTKSPFDHDGTHANFSAQVQYSALSEAFSPKFNGVYSTRFGEDNRYGLLIAPTWQQRKFGSYNYETGGAWSLDDDSGVYVIDEVNYREYEVERERYGVTTAFEARPDAFSHFYVRGGYNRFTDKENRHNTLMIFEDGDLADAGANFGVITTDEERLFARRLRMREKDQEVFSLVIGGEREFGSWQWDAQAGFTEGREKRPEELQARYRPAGDEVTTLRYDTDGPYGFALTQTAGSDLYDPATYEFQRFDLANESGDETEYDLAMNIRRDLETATPAFVKFGTLYRSKEKTSQAEVYEVGDGPASLESLADNNIGPGAYPYLRVPRIDPDAMRAAFYGNQDSFEFERIFEDSEFDDWTVNEDVLAGYFMGGATFGKLHAIAGVRVERTSFDTRGKDLDLDNGVAVPVSASRSYTNWLPGVYLRHNVNDQLVLRASWSNSLARPSFGDTALRRLISDDDSEITIGNPELDPLEATNWDVSVEYYLPSLGVVSAALFHKDIKNFSYEFDSEEPVVIDGQEYDVTTFANGSEGSITGLELAWQQQLRFLPGPFNGLGALANFTFLDSEATYPTRPDERVPFIGQSDMVGNVGLTYEKGGFFARLVLNFRSERLREDEALGGEFAEDLYVDDFAQLDLTMRYQVNRNWEIFAEVINLTDEPFRVYQKSDNGQGRRLGQFEAYDWSANLGFRWKM